MKRLVTVATMALALFLAACSGGGYGTVGQTNPYSGNGNPGGSMPPTAPTSSTALFQVAAGVLPYPTDLYFAGSTDGTLNIQPPNAAMPNQAAINALDGFSTTAVIRERFGGALDPTSFTAGVIIVPVTTDNMTKATTGVLGLPLTPGVDYRAGLGEETGVGASILEITPLHPLMPSTCLQNGQFLGPKCATGAGYLVFLTTAIKDASGHPAVADADYTTIKSALAGGATCPSITDPTLKGVCQLTGAHLQIAKALGIDATKIVLSFSFTTQSTLDTLELVSATAQPQALTVHATGLTTAAIPGLGLPGHADLYVGVLNIPYYLSKSAPLTEYWHAPPFPLDPTSTFVTRFNPVPVPTQTLQIPVLVSVPNAKSTLGGTAPAGGWPVLIFQHGITRDREDMFGVADSFADAGFVVAAIDLPLHGITSTSDPLYATGANPLYVGLGLPAKGSIERTFDLSTITPGQIDPSGTHFINLTSLLTSRDNLREGAADLITLARSLPQMNLTGGVNKASIHYLGHSLGAIVGGTFLGVIPAAEVGTGTLANPGGEVARLLRDSPTFAPQINAGLAAQGVPPGTTLYEQFFRDAQTAVDAADPINFIAVATAGHPIHLIQVVGSATPPAICTVSPTPDGCPDQVVPNSATQRLITASSYLPAPLTAMPLMQLVRPAAPGAQVNPGGFRAYVNFVVGSHGSVIDPSTNGLATVEMQTEAISFASASPAGAAGNLIFVGNPAVIQP
jgi:pimeloyl-ACP methyl ester carboxylesterase